MSVTRVPSCTVKGKKSGIMIVSKLDRGRDAVNVRPPDTEGVTSMLNHSTTSLFGDPRLPARFWDKVRIGAAPSIRPDLGPCWLWVACLVDGYGRVYRGKDTSDRAHRWAYEQLIGMIPSGLQTDHLCRVRACVNPSHMEPVTPSVNTLRGQTIPARNKRVTHCPRGHPYDETNTYRGQNPYGDGYRKCRACRREWHHRRKVLA